MNNPKILDDKMCKYYKRVKSISLRCYVLLKILVIDYNYIALIQRKPIISPQFTYYPINKLFNEQQILVFDFNSFNSKKTTKMRYNNQRICLQFLISELESKGYIFQKHQTRKITSSKNQFTLTKIKWVLFENSILLKMEELENTIGNDIHTVLNNLATDLGLLFNFYIYSQYDFIPSLNNLILKEYDVNEKDIYWIKERMKQNIIQEYLPFLETKMSTDN